MDAKEFEEQLTDLETRLDRLRALYENWFRGYEKMEPQVARKEVERRVYALRKELPRNTALRFRYHQLFQRFTTMQSYWSRTAKQIEEGTYRLQLQRLRRKHANEEEQQRPKRTKKRRDDEEVPAPASYELSLDESLDIKDLLGDDEIDEVARAIDRPGRHSEPPPPVMSPAKAIAKFARPSDTQGSSPKPAPARGAWSDADTSEPLFPNPAPAAPQKSVAGAAASAPSVAQKSGAGVVPAPPPNAKTGAGVPVPPPPVLGAPQKTAAGIAGLPVPQLKMPRATVGDVPPPPPGLGAPKAVPRPGAPMTPSGVRPAGIAPEPPKAPPPPPAAVRPAPMAPSHSASGAVLPEQRLKSIYDEYANARRRNNEGEVRYETLVRSIEKMMPELSKKHAGKQIDFEVVLKDGRVGLKPKAK